MKILVTGGCGFLGSHLTDALINEGHEVAVVDNLSTGKRENLNPRATFYEVDITGGEYGAVFESFMPEVVYHKAAQTMVQCSIHNPKLDSEVNIKGSIATLELCAKCGVKKIIYASSAAIYGNPHYLGIDEAHPLNPISFYGISKYTPEQYIKVFSALHGLEYTILRYANVYGSRQNADGEAAVIPRFLDKFKKGDAPTIYGDGTDTRDYIFVGDIVRADIAALYKAKNEIINVGTGIPVTINELYKAIAEVCGKDITPVYAAPRPGDIQHSYYNVEKQAAALGITIEFSLRSGLAKTMEER